jgi:hypothetical protein
VAEIRGNRNLEEVVTEIAPSALAELATLRIRQHDKMMPDTTPAKPKPSRTGHARSTPSMMAISLIPS